MKDEEFNNLQKGELLNGAKFCYQSAQGLYQGAVKLSENKFYGIANSLLILSSEECIKGFLLLARYINVPIPYSIEPFFKNHLKKHEEASEIQPIVTTISNVKDLINILSGKSKSRIPFLDLGVMALSTYFDFKKIRTNEYNDWWNTANENKKNGFYVGYNEGNWKSPTDFTEEKYLETLHIVKPFLQNLKVVDSLKPDDYKLL